MRNYSRFQRKSTTRPSVCWAKFDKSPFEMAQGMTKSNLYVFLGFSESGFYGYDLGDAFMPDFRDPASFFAGYLSIYISKVAPYELTPKILNWIKNCVDVHEFFVVWVKWAALTPLIIK